MLGSFKSFSFASMFISMTYDFYTSRPFPVPTAKYS